MDNRAKRSTAPSISTPLGGAIDLASARAKKTSVIRQDTPMSISDPDPGLPYSKGLMASQVMVTGLSAYRAYEVAETIEAAILDEGRLSSAPRSSPGSPSTRCADLAGERCATSFTRWQDVQRSERAARRPDRRRRRGRKSTIATHLAHRLGIVRVVATDGSIREVMRAMLSSELMPALHVSSFQADKAVRERTRRSDALVGGFREQTQAVSVGIEAMIKRSVTEGTSIVIEGARRPGFFDVTEHGDRLVAVPLILEVEDEAKHLNHFAVRETGVRPAERYAQNFENIRKLQRYVKSQALSHGVPIVEPQLRPGDLRRPRSRDGAGDGLGGAARAARGEREEDGMRLFLDTASIEEIREINRWGPVRRHDEPVARGQGGRGPRRGLEGDPRGGGRRHLSRDHRARGGSDGRGGRRLAGMAPNAVVRGSDDPARPWRPASSSRARDAG